MKFGVIPVPDDAPTWMSNVISSVQSWVLHLRTGPQPLSGYLVADLPDATTNRRKLIYVDNESGGAVPAFSDGTNWRRVTDRAIVS